MFSPLMKGNRIIVSGNGIIKTILSGDFYSFREINILENEFDSIYELDKERIILYNIGDSYFTIMNTYNKKNRKNNQCSLNWNFNDCSIYGRRMF